jgi:hypothetical protein
MHEVIEPLDCALADGIDCIASGNHGGDCGNCSKEYDKQKYSIFHRRPPLRPGDGLFRLPPDLPEPYADAAAEQMIDLITHGEKKAGAGRERRSHKCQGLLHIKSPLVEL